MAEEIINRVAESGLVNLDLESLVPNGEVVMLDIAPVLWQGQILREKDFRDFIADHDWTVYNEKLVAVQCTTDAIIPHWAYMLITAKLEGIASHVQYGSSDDLRIDLIRHAIREMDPADFEDKRVLIKGCASLELDPGVYMEITGKLLKGARSIMYGEACSTVPVFKKPRSVER